MIDRTRVLALAEAALVDHAACPDGDWAARDVYVYRSDNPLDHRQVCRVPTVQVDPRTPHPIAHFIAKAHSREPELARAVIEQAKEIDRLRTYVRELEKAAP